MKWQTIPAAEWVTAFLCSWAGISYQGKTGAHLLSHLKSWMRTSVSKPGTSAPFRGHVKTSTRTHFVASVESDFSGKTGLLQIGSPGSERSQRKNLPYFLAKLIAPLLVKMPDWFVPFSQLLPGFPLLIWRGQCSQTPLLLPEILQQVLRTICLDICTRILDKCP